MLKSAYNKQQVIIIKAFVGFLVASTTDVNDAKYIFFNISIFFEINYKN